MPVRHADAPYLLPSGGLRRESRSCVPRARRAPVTACDLVTGGTGMLGSHIAERLIAQGRRVRALVRPGSDARFLEGLGVEVVRGDLTDPSACARAVRDVE